MKLLKRILAVTLLSSLLLPLGGLTSCSIMTKARKDLATMSQPEYDSLRSKVHALSLITSRRISKNWDAEKLAKAAKVIAKGHLLVQSNKPAAWAKLDATSLIRTLADKYAEELGLSARTKMDIQDATILLDVIVGPIQLGIDGKLGEREKGLATALLDGLGDGLRR